MKKFYALLVITLLIIAGCSQNTKKPIKKEAVSATKEMTRQTTIPEQINPEIDAQIAKLYSGIILRVIDMETGTTKDVKVLLNEVTTVPNTNLIITVSKIYPDFVIDEKGYTTRTMNPSNIAAKVKIIHENLEFEGWLFQQFPEVHPYETKFYDIKLIDIIKR